MNWLTLTRSGFRSIALRLIRTSAAIGACCLLAGETVAQTQQPGTLRIATFNCSLNRDRAGELLLDIQAGTHPQILNVARILRHVRPDVVLLNEFDFDESGQSVALFQQLFLEAERDDVPSAPLHYPSTYFAPVNTGVPSGRDLDHDGRTDGPGDALGYGRFPGQYGMVLLSRYPIQREAARTFRKLLWKQMPAAALPVSPTDGISWYSDDDLQILRLSSKSHWDVPVLLPGGKLHVLASHPTPPAFDGPEDRNGTRNHDEIRLWAEYLNPAPGDWLIDDSGQPGPLPHSEHFVILGDLNADPADGNSFPGAIQQLLNHPRVNTQKPPTSHGGVAASASQQGVNAQHRGLPELDTADFSDRVVGNLRVDYVLPDRDLKIRNSAVFWPVEDEVGSDWISCSDHRLVWLDVEFPANTGRK